MKDPIRLPRLPFRRIKLYGRIWLSVMMVRIRLTIFGYRSFERSPVRVRSTKINVEPVYIANVVARASRFVPGALCLAQSLTAQRQLARYGFDTTMRIGVKSDDGGKLLAHAWLLHNDLVILGGTDVQLEDYEIMTDMKSATI